MPPAQPEFFSLLWRDAAALENAPPPSDSPADDLRVQAIAETIAPRKEYLRPVHKLLSTLLLDVETLRYRQEALEDCLRQPEFADGLSQLLPALRELHNTVRDIRARRNQVSLVLSRLSELDRYAECLLALDGLLLAHEDGLRSRAWRGLAAAVRSAVDDPLFQQMVAELPGLSAGIRQVVSVTIGVNLSPDLKPVAATLLSLNRRRFRGPRFFRAFWDDGADEDWRGVASLREAPDAQRYRAGGVLAQRRETLDRLAASALFGDLGKVLDDVIRPINRALERYTRVKSGLLRAIEPELAFYVGGAALTRDLRARGLPMTAPVLLPSASRELRARSLYNLDLALRLRDGKGAEDLGAQIVPSDVRFDADGRVLILTGPNRGGKTTYIQAIGLLHVLAQAGLYAPAEAVELSPVDAIHSHFPAVEKPYMESGRLGEEAQRLRAIFAKATARSLLLLNESLHSTSATESFYLARDVVRCLRVLGARALMVTHLHELAADCEAINAEPLGESRVQSIVAQMEEGETGSRRTFKIVPAPPRGQSYALEIARQYGISFEQLKALLDERANEGGAG